jgi:hypothetical protein
MRLLKRLNIDNLTRPELVIAKHNTEIHEFDTLDQAMAWAKELGKFVTIQFNDLEVVGKFGADGINDGKFPNSEA